MKKKLTLTLAMFVALSGNNATASDRPNSERKPSLAEKFAPKENFSDRDLDAFKDNYVSDNGEPKNGARYQPVKEGKAPIIFPAKETIEMLRNLRTVKAAYEAGKAEALILESEEEKEAYVEWLKNNIKRVIVTTPRVERDHYIESFPNLRKHLLDLKPDSVVLFAMVKIYERANISIINIQKFGQIIATLEINNMHNLVWDTLEESKDEKKLWEYKSSTFEDLNKFFGYYFHSYFDGDVEQELISSLNDALADVKKQEAASVIQRSYKGYKARQEFSSLKDEKNKQDKKAAAAKKIAAKFDF